MFKSLRQAAALVVLTSPVLTAAAADYRWLNSFDRNHDGVPNFVEPYIKAVEAASNGRFKFVVSGPETVPAFEQLQPVGAGAFQFMFTHGSYHFGTTPLLAAVEALGGTRQQRKASGVIELVDKRYAKLGVKLLALPMTADGGYQILLRKPPTGTGGLEGYKIRGVPTFQPVIKLLGASMITLAPAEIYTAVEKGVVDGFAYPSFGVLRSRLYEPVKFLLRPTFGFIANPVLVNLNTWNGFSAADKKLLLDEAAKAEENWANATAKIYADEEKELITRGLKTVEMGSAQKAALQKAYSEGIWDLASQKAKAEVDEMRALARSKGL